MVLISDGRYFSLSSSRQRESDRSANRQIDGRLIQPGQSDLLLNF